MLKVKLKNDNININPINSERNGNYEFKENFSRNKTELKLKVKLIERLQQ